MDSLANLTIDDKVVDEPNEKPKSSKRTNYLAWDEYFMAMALLTAERSKDPVTQVGAVIVDKQNVIAGVGYNGMPRGCHDDKMPWSKDMENPLENKYLFVVHAEINAILNRSILRDECTMYVTLFPCSECAKAVIQSGIKRIVYLRDKPTKVEMQASKLMFDMAGVKFEKFVTKRSEVLLKLD